MGTRKMVKSQITTSPATLSMSESMPKPTSAIDDAASPAPIAIANSTKCHAMPPDASIRARRCRLNVSAGVSRAWSDPNAIACWLIA